jgi:hypothetical protein
MLRPIGVKGLKYVPVFLGDTGAAYAHTRVMANLNS